MSSLLHLLGQLFVFAALVIACGAILRHMAVAAFGSGTRRRGAASGRGAKALRSPAPRAARQAGRSALSAAAHPGNRQIRAQARADRRRLWAAARSTDWLERRRHERANGTAGTVTQPRRRLRLRPFAVNRPGADGNGHAPPPEPANEERTEPPGGDGDGPWWRTDGADPPDDGRYHLKKRPPAPPGPSPAASTNGGVPVAAGTSTASAEKLIEGINEVHAHAQSGGIHAKREAVKAIHEGLIRFGAMLGMLSRQMSEPGQHYGPEITEPLAQSGQYCQAGAMSASEADAAISTLINMTVGELATSPRRAPHHEELSESGAR